MTPLAIAIEALRRRAATLPIEVIRTEFERIFYPTWNRTLAEFLTQRRVDGER